MNKLKTRHFGEIEYDSSRVITFTDGLLGLPEQTRYLLMSEKEDEDTYFWLQSVEDGDIAFTLMNVYKILPDYNPLVEFDEIEGLGDIAEESLEIYNIIVIPEYVRHMRVNLRAPVVINNDTGYGKQIICTNDDYPIRFMVFEELERRKKKDAGTNS